MSTTAPEKPATPDTEDNESPEGLASRQAMHWALIDKIGNEPFMPGGREQPPIPSVRSIFED